MIYVLLSPLPPLHQAEFSLPHFLNLLFPFTFFFIFFIFLNIIVIPPPLPMKLIGVPEFKPSHLQFFFSEGWSWNIPYWQITKYSLPYFFFCFSFFLVCLCVDFLSLLFRRLEEWSEAELQRPIYCNMISPWRWCCLLSTFIDVIKVAGLIFKENFIPVNHLWMTVFKLPICVSLLSVCRFSSLKL